MGASADVSILLQALDGTWERCGSDRAIGVVPESLEASDNESGSDIASFDLKRSPIALWPDLGSFAPVVIEIGGVPSWRGRTGETPIKDGAAFVINVQCRGMQYHLDDDVYQRAYVHQKLADYKDLRSIPTASLGANAAAAAGQVSTDNAITLTWPSGTPWLVGSIVGVVLDLGPYSRAAAIAIDYETSNNTAAMYFFVRACSTPNLSGSTSDAYSNPLTTMTASGTIAANFPSVAYRYVHLFMFANPAATPGADVWVKIKRAQVFTEQAFRSGSASVLRASTIARDALVKGTMLLSDDTSQIAATSFDIPEFVLNGMRTPREVIDAANAFHNWTTKVDLADRLVFGPRPSAPTLEVGAFSGASFEDSSANSGAEIYNKCVVEGQGPDGVPIVVERTSGQQSGVLFTPISSPAAVNPSADVDTSGWSATSGAVARDTSVFLSSPASIRWSGMASGSTLSADMAGTFIRGITYRITLNMQSTLAMTGFDPFVFVAIGDAAGGLSAAANRWGTITLSWTPTSDTVNPDLQIYVQWSLSAPTIYVDDIAVSAVQPTLVDRRGFRKAKVLQPSFMLTPAVAQQLADTFLAGHKTMPLKGSLRVTPGGCRRVAGGQPIHPSQLLGKSQELMRLSHRIDPDTGAVGRTGTIVSVRYTHRDQSATVELDDPRRNFEALLSRLAVLQGAG